MDYKISVNVPRCPKCTGKLRSITDTYDILYVCNTCNQRFKVVDSSPYGTYEVIVSDDIEEVETEEE